MDSENKENDPQTLRDKKDFSSDLAIDFVQTSTPTTDSQSLDQNVSRLIDQYFFKSDTTTPQSDDLPTSNCNNSTEASLFASSASVTDALENVPSPTITETETKLLPPNLEQPETVGQSEVQRSPKPTVQTLINTKLIDNITEILSTTSLAPEVDLPEKEPTVIITTVNEKPLFRKEVGKQDVQKRRPLSPLCWRTEQGRNVSNHASNGNLSIKDQLVKQSWRTEQGRSVSNLASYDNLSIKDQPVEQSWRTKRGKHLKKVVDNDKHFSQKQIFTVKALLLQKPRYDEFFVKVENGLLRDERLKCYFRNITDTSIPMVAYKTKFLLGIKFVDGRDQKFPSDKKTIILWANAIEYIELTSSDVRKAFESLHEDMTHEEIVQKLYFTWKPFLESFVKYADELDEKTLALVLTRILPPNWDPQSAEDNRDHQIRFQEIIKLLSSRENNFLQQLGRFSFTGNEELVKKMIELVATTTKNLDSVFHLLERYYDGDCKGLLHLIERCCKTFDPGNRSLAAQHFRDLPLIPVMEELKGVISSSIPGVPQDPEQQSLLQLESHLKPNRIDGPWESPEEFLDVHFRLLREECFASIRERIARIRLEPWNYKQVHSDVRVISYAVSDGSIVVNIKFKPGKSSSRSDLMYGNLLCFDVDPKFSNPIWATVMSTTMKRDEIAVSLVGAGNDYIASSYKSNLAESPSARAVIPALQRLIVCQSGVMVGSPTYYHAFRPVLARLQTLSPIDFPFASEILLQSTTPVPDDATVRSFWDWNGDDYNFEFYDSDDERSSWCFGLRDRDTMYAMGDRRFGLDNLDDGYLGFENFDESQKLAVETSLENRFSLIQGPPGCGKTFVGKEIVREILKARSCDGPILVISYKNHSLDSFLESCLEFTNSLVRIGGNSKSKTVAEFNLHNQIPIMKCYSSKSEYQELQDARGQLQRMAEMVEMAAENSLTHFTPLALFRFLFSELGVGKQQLHSLLAKNFEENYGRVIKQDYKCESFEAVQGAVTDIVNHHPETAVKILSYALNQWLSESESEKYLPKPHRSLLVNTVPPQRINHDANNVHNADETEELEWEQEVAERFVGSENKIKFKEIPQGKTKMYPLLQKRMAYIEPDGREREVLEVEDIWSLTPEGRYVLLSYWLRVWREKHDEYLFRQLEHYNRFYQQVKKKEEKRNVSFLRSRSLIGCTITGCCLKMGVLSRVAPTVAIVEEAAEILESQLIAALPSSVRHVVLVGDHKQLPPQVHHYRLKQRFNLGVSIFERLANNGYPVVQLRHHRRGPRSLCSLFSQFYEQEIEPLKEDPTPPDALTDIGIMYWWTHEAPSQISSNGISFENEFEAAMIVGAVHFLILLGNIEASKISIITAYLGQAKKINQLLFNDGVEGVNVCTVDRFQGDENDFIFLSLTRSINEKTEETQPQLGFLASPNRTCVALSRARIGLYVFGCSRLFQSHPTWMKVVKIFREKGKIGHELRFNIAGKVLPFEHPNDFVMFFKKLALEQQAMKLRIHEEFMEDLPKLNLGVHDVTKEFRNKMESLMNKSILNRQDLGRGRDSDGQRFRSFKVTKVKRIFVQDMYLTYLFHQNVIDKSQPPPLDFEVDSKAKWMVELLNKNVNEVFLFHGTKSSDIAEIIAKTGFDERVANVGLYGAGIYFAENADKSDHYTKPEGAAGERTMFLARVTLGYPYKTTSGYKDRRPPPIDPTNPTKLFDSVIAVSARKGYEDATSRRHQEFILFDRFLCVPEFIIKYVHTE